MTSKEINEFKEDLKHYRYLNKIVEELLEEIDYIYYQETGVKGIAYDRVIGTTNTHQKALRRLEMIDEIERLEKKLKEPKDKLDKINNILDKMSYYDRSIFHLKYLKGLTFQEVANKCYISKAGLFYRMNKALEKVDYEK